MQYLVSQSVAEAIDAELPTGVTFAHIDAQGRLVHDASAAAEWPSEIDKDAVVVAADVGALDYANLLATLESLADQQIKIYRYVIDLNGYDLEVPPLDIDYRTDLSQRLQPERTFFQGELTDVRYHASATLEVDGSVTYDDLVVHEEYTYFRDAMQFAVRRELVITYYREDGSAHPTTKVMSKIYSATERISEGRRRRGNIIDELENEVAGMLIVTELANQGGDIEATLGLGRALLRHYKDDIDLYISASLPDLVTLIRDDAIHPWLDNVVATNPSRTIRDEILVKIDIYGIL